jgi:flagellar motility protein MotE (MotC chaperone)
MRTPKNIIGGALFGLALVLSAAAGTAAAKERILTEDSVSRFLKSFSEMRAIAISEGLKTGADSEAAKNPLGAVLKAIKSSKLKTETAKIAAAHGFTDLKDWTGAGRSIAQAYLFITVGPARGIARQTLEKNKDATINQLEKFGLLNAKSKEKLKADLDSLEDQLASEPPPENVAIVTKMKGEIDAAVKFGVN